AELRTADPALPEGLERIRGAIRSTSGVLVAAAAKRIIEHDLAALAEHELVPAYQRLLERPEQRDPACRGKIAIARALHELDRWEDEVFVHGVTYVQEEPAWPRSVDTAAELRGISGLAHAHFHRPDALDVLAVLLADPERTARVAAAQGFGDAGRPDAAAVLRFKLLLGDAEAEVLSACCESLLVLQREAALAFLPRFLNAVDDRAEATAVALGASRLPAAVPHLERWCDHCKPEQRARVGYLALALSRTDAGTARLLDVIRGGRGPDAVAAARALATFKDDPSILRQLQEAAAAQRDLAARQEIEALI
ncbi:MAG TPA: hypothetical protein VN253_04945, partial [Kofleriaceae bacterium]|nr:hypothetical protein [Kofleriaceae bacterium]